MNPLSESMIARRTGEPGSMPGPAWPCVASDIVFLILRMACVDQRTDRGPVTPFSTVQRTHRAPINAALIPAAVIGGGRRPGILTADVGASGLSDQAQP